MATQSKRFVDNLGKIYGGYAGGFIGFVIILAIMEQMGVSNKVIGYCFVFLTIGVYAYIGIISRTSELSEYYVAGRVVPPFFNGMATGADWMSAASFISMAGGLYLAGYGGLGYVLGWTGGYVLVGVLLAPYLRKFGQFTVPDFLGVRYEGNTARVCGVIVLFCASFTYIVAQCFGIGIITSRFLDIPFEVAIFVGLLGILVCSMLGGMRAVTWTQVAQYIILIIAYLVPVVWLSFKLYGNPLPQLAYGNVLEQIAQLEQKLGIVKPHIARLRRRQGPVQLGRVQQLLGAGAHPDDRYGVAAAHPDALLHDAERARCAEVGRLEHLLHLPALLHRAGLRRVRQAGGLHERDRPADRLAARLGAELVAGRRPAHDQGREQRRHPAARASSSSTRTSSSCRCRRSRACRT